MHLTPLPELLPVLDGPVDLVVHGDEQREGHEDHDRAVGPQHVDALVHGVRPEGGGGHEQGALVSRWVAVLLKYFCIHGDVSIHDLLPTQRPDNGFLFHLAQRFALHHFL